MPDLDLSVTVTRDDLSMDPLEINDFVDYYVASTFLGANVGWNRTQIGSPWLDGSITTNRTRQVVNEPVVVEVMAETAADMKVNVDTLIQAFLQDSFDMVIAFDGSPTYGYRCEAADYQMGWNGPRMVAGQIQVTFSMPRQPSPLLGIA